VDVSVELVGSSRTMHQAVKCLAPLGRAVLVGITRDPLTLDTYQEVLGSETQVIGSNDHLLSELPMVIEMARRGILDTSRVVTKSIPLDAAAINAALDGLEKYSTGIRTVVTP
jgi:propanol-preferring alcohol dehydrogenase